MQGGVAACVDSTVSETDSAEYGYVSISYVIAAVIIALLSLHLLTTLLNVAMTATSSVNATSGRLSILHNGVRQ